MKGKVKLTLVAQPQEFFRELLVDAMKKQKVRTQEETEFYLVNLMNEFMTTDRLFVQDTQGQKREEPLALMLKDALEQPQPKLQGLIFRQIGDISLYRAGFFPESLARKLVDLDYYIDMGGSAYLQVAQRSGELFQRNVFEELAKKFAQLVEVFSEVAVRTSQRTEKDLVHVYGNWVKTGNKQAAKVLEKEGLLPPQAHRILKKGSK